MSGILREFSNANPQIEVEEILIEFYKAREKFKESVKSDSGPDLLRADRFWIPDFASADIVSEIKRSVVKEEYEDMVPLARDFVSWQGKMWAMPISVDCLALFYNKKHFASNNVKVPINFDEFLVAAQKLTDRNSGRYGFFIYPNGWYFEPFFFGFGGQYFAPDGSLAIRSDAATKAFEYLLHLKDRLKAVPPVNLRAKIYNTMINGFGSGQVSMIFTGPWAIRSIINGTDFKRDNSNLGIAQLPAGPHGTFSPTGCQTIVISKKSKHQEAALKFARYMFSYEAQKKLVMANYGMPARKSVFAAPELKQDPYIQVFIKQLQMSRKANVSQFQGDIYAPLGDKLKDVLNGDLTPEYAINDIIAEWKANHK
ncbi:MAG: extracellular solute-binding protein [Candidatus Riflebacteria bacterium]|nr:extracellular solute-binding protein [Candidatus Riflebacteria bacterium]